jgi:hypothetical protein
MFVTRADNSDMAVLSSAISILNLFCKLIPECCKICNTDKLGEIILGWRYKICMPTVIKASSEAIRTHPK